MPVGRAPLDRVVPHTAYGVVEKHPLKAVVQLDGPSSVLGNGGQEVASEAQPPQFEGGTVRFGPDVPERSGSVMVSDDVRQAPGG